MTRNADHLITLNMGVGRDSIAMLCLLVERALVVGGEAIGPEDVDAVIFSDTGAEWKHTYAELPKVRALCEAHGLRFLVLEKPDDATWQANLRERGSRDAPAWVVDGEAFGIERKAAMGAYHLRLPIMAEFKRFAKIAVTVSASCTENHKVGPIRRCMNDLSMERWGVNNRAWSQAVRKGERPQHEVLIGIAADEATRAIDTGRPCYEKPRYPLADMGIAKADEAAILERHGFGAVRKSGCIMCPYQGLGWFWALRETDPERWTEVVEYEATANAENPKMIVAGRSGALLSAAVDKWRTENPDATIGEVLDKAYSRCRAHIPSVPASQLALWAAA